MEIETDALPGRPKGSASEEPTVSSRLGYESRRAEGYVQRHRLGFTHWVFAWPQGVVVRVDIDVVGTVLTLQELRPHATVVALEWVTYTTIF